MYVCIYFLLVLSCSFVVNLFSPYGFIRDRIRKPDGRFRTLKEGANATNKANNCPQALDILPDFIECERGTLLYSAWFDDRYAENYIQVLLIFTQKTTTASFMSFPKWVNFFYLCKSCYSVL